MTIDEQIIHRETAPEAEKTPTRAELRAKIEAELNSALTRAAPLEKLLEIEKRLAEVWFHEDHKKVLTDRGIKPLLAYYCGLNGVDLHDEMAKWKADGMPKREAGQLALHPTTGIKIPYQKCLDDLVRYRVRADEEGTADNPIPRYISQKGYSVVPWLPYKHCGVQGIGLMPPRKEDEPLFIVEAPLKALSLLSHKYYAVGLGGVQAGALDKEAPGLQLHKELLRLDLDGRQCFVAFDAGAAWNASVALGVAQLSGALANAGAIVRVVTLPAREDAKSSQLKSRDQGPDDYLVQHGKKAFDGLVAAAFDPDPVTRVEAALASGGDKKSKSKAVLALLKDLVFVACLHVGGTTLAAEVVAASGGLLGAKLLTDVSKEFSRKIQVRKKTDGAATAAADDNCPYAVVDGCMVRTTKRGYDTLAYFQAKIVEEKEVKTAEGSHIVYALEGEQSGDEKHGRTLDKITVPAAEFAKMEWPNAQWGSRACIEAGAKDSVRAAIQMLSSPLRKTVYSLTGWQRIGRPVYMLPGGGINFQGNQEYEVEVAGLERYKIGQVPKDREAAQAAMRAPLELLQAVAPDRLTAPLLCFTYLAPLASMIGGIPMVLWLKGQTGCGKSSLAALAQCHFGEFGRHSLPVSWTSTVNAIEMKVASARDTLITIDNMVPANNGKEQTKAQSDATRLIQNIGDGQTRNRLNAKAEAKPGLKLRAAVIATAEILPPGEGESTLGRCLVLEMERGDLNIPSVKQLCDHFLPDFSVAMAGYIQWLAGLESEEIKSAHKEAQSYAMQDHPELLGAHPRTRDSLALLTLGQIMFVRYAGTLGVSASYLTARIQAGLLEAVSRQPRPIAATAVDLWLSTLNSLLMGGTVSLADSPTGSLHSYNHGETKVGWISGTEIWLDPELSYSVVAKHLGARWTYSKSELQRQLRTAKTTMDDGTEIAVLARRGDGDHTCYRVTTGTRPRVLALDSRCLPGAGAVSIDLDDDDDDDDAALAGLLDDAGPHLH